MNTWELFGKGQRINENNKEVDYDDDYQDMVRRVGEKAKAADALKAQGKQPQTKFNPKTGKYYVDFGQDKEVEENAEELNVGDPVIITGNVEFEGTTGEIVEFGQGKRFVIVNLYNHGKHSFHSSDVEYNDHADLDEAGYGRNRGYTPGVASPHAPALGGRRHREDDEGWEQERQAQSVTWYIRVNGKIIKDKMGVPYQYRGKEAATKAARTMMAKPFNAGKKFMLTTNPVDDQPENEAVLHTQYKHNRFKAVRQRDQAQDKAANMAMNRVNDEIDEGMSGQVVFSGTGTNSVKYEIIQSGDGFMIHANGNHIDTYGSLQRAMSVLKNEVPGLQRSMAEATGDKPFDKMMTTIKQGTNKQKTADRKEQQKQTQQRARDAFGNMFGGGNPADKLSIRKGVAEGLKSMYHNAVAKHYGRKADDAFDNGDEEGFKKSMDKNISHKLKAGEKIPQVRDPKKFQQGMAEGVVDTVKKIGKKLIKPVEVPGLNQMKAIHNAELKRELAAQNKKYAPKDVTEAEKNPHTSALGRALYRDLSKQPKLSPQQVQRNKERWAQRQAEREQGVAEGLKADELSRYCEELVAEKGWDAAYKHARFMAQGNTDPAWGSVLKYLRAMKHDLDEAGSAAQQAAIAINMKKHHKKPKHIDEFAPPGGDDGNDGFSDETLKRMAAQWWQGDEDPRIEKTLMAAGWEIGQDEGYDNGGVFVVMSGDEHGRSYMSWPAEELEGMNEGWKSALGGAALAGAMALGGGAHAQSSGEDFLPDIVAHVTFKVNGNTVTKDINLGNNFKSPGEASAVLQKFLKDKGIKFYDFSIERVKPDNRRYLEKTPASDTGHSGSMDSGPYSASGSSSDYMAKESIDEAIDRAVLSMMEDGYEFTEEKVRLDPKCWKGKKIGNPKTKMKGGVRVNNCVPQ